uniref:C-type lectin domain family 4 member F-like n=1 Tax=Phallusia mammillata TaxID=59560 RepID=A0A6F9DA22_9ASCI|nr:C-type lectin domain family 4 member F-like [Phallusia mammillata]
MSADMAYTKYTTMATENESYNLGQSSPPDQQCEAMNDNPKQQVKLEGNFAKNVIISKKLFLGIICALFLTTIVGFIGLYGMVSKLQSQLGGVGTFTKLERHNATCLNGGIFIIESRHYKCLCASGFGGIRCEKDIVECSTGTHDCHQHATCINTVGSFQCSCNVNYTGDGRQCRPNFCSTNVGLCKNNGTCMDTSTAYNCSCNIWYSGNNCEQEQDHVIMTRKRKWANARKYCQSIGGDLATWGMRNATVRNWIVANMLQTGGPLYYFIGLNDLEQEGVWNYVDGVPVTKNNTNFFPGEPNGGRGAHCAGLSYYYGYVMDDLNCYLRQSAICERLLH